MRFTHRLGLREYPQRLIEMLPVVEVSSDPDDNPVLAMARAGDADYLVTGDKGDLLALEQFGKTKVFTARRFVDALDL